MSRWYWLCTTYSRIGNSGTHRLRKLGIGIAYKTITSRANYSKFVSPNLFNVSDKFSPIPLERLLPLVLSGIKENNFHGIPGTLFFKPLANDPIKLQRYGVQLDTPVGVAAGPHTQLSQNIIAAWLCGARYIELKTIQTLDELSVSKPCIDMQDEGYNCEWSQELTIRESFTEYLNAWIMIHILSHELGFGPVQGTIFNMSIGYNLEGILKENVQWFLRKMSDCSHELNEALKKIRSLYPAVDSLHIPATISNNITLSTMHGCPPDEIEKIAHYLVVEKGLHTTVKLNPTLLGASNLRKILNEQNGFLTDVPDLAFEHDLKYQDAIRIIKNLINISDKKNLQFSVKLTNTLESRNNRKVFSGKEEMMYMSGRALHPISIAVALKLQEDFGGALDISFSAGVDCFNLVDVISCGLKPVTVCSDLLKPGGYGRLWQYILNLREACSQTVSGSLEQLIVHRSGLTSLSPDLHALSNLKRYNEQLKKSGSYKRLDWHEPDIKTDRELGFFDCIHAPCIDTCPTHQEIPEYLSKVAEGDLDSAYQTILRTNPFPSVTGMICDHPCQLKCTRIHYDDPLHIRDIKRFVAENVENKGPGSGMATLEKRVAVIGAGPAGLSCAWFLAKEGITVDVYEQKAVTGGMITAAIPAFRLTDQATENDIRSILNERIRLHEHYKVTAETYTGIAQSHDAVFLAAGAQKAAGFKLEGAESKGVLDPLELLYQAKSGTNILPGNQVVIIGGGNTAMDAARTAFRLAGPSGNVTVLYRRSRKEMPADSGEIKAILEEGVRLMELVNPVRILSENGRVHGILCARNVLAMAGTDGRPLPIQVPGSEFSIACDVIIPAIGQELDIDFIDKESLQTVPGSYQTRIPGLYLGGDALRGASTAINAIADGRLAALEIMKNMGITSAQPVPGNHLTQLDELLHHKAVRQRGIHPKEKDLAERVNFELVMQTYNEQDARTEASRCLRCDLICNVCVSVCPNLANFSYKIQPFTYRLQKARRDEAGNTLFEEDTIFSVDQAFQVLNIRDLCNECGNCTTFCPSSGKPYLDKPGLSLSLESFNRETEGFYLSRLPGKDILIYKHHESYRTLTLEKGVYVYETDQIRAELDLHDFSIHKLEYLAPCTRESKFMFAAGMSVILQGALQFYN